MEFYIGAFFGGLAVWVFFIAVFMFIRCLGYSFAKKIDFYILSDNFGMMNNTVYRKCARELRKCVFEKFREI